MADSTLNTSGNCHPVANFCHSAANFFAKDQENLCEEPTGISFDILKKCLTDKSQFEYYSALKLFDTRPLTPWKYDGMMRERFWTPALKQAQVKYRRPYNCRHTYASTMLTAGKDPTWLAKQMGHKDWGMIRMVYARWIDN